jgi:hypothetical protein
VSREANKPLSIWKATSLDSVQEHHLPLHSELQDFVKSGPDAGELCYQYDTAVESVHYDKVFDSSMFWPKIGPETSVIDLVNNTYSSPKIDSSKVVTATSGKVITATPTDSSWSFSGILLGCGIVILVAASVLRWRSR